MYFINYIVWYVSLFVSCSHSLLIIFQDVLRQVIHPDDYPEMQRLSKIHLRHCIGVIRQSLMCFSDITPIVWQWNETLHIGDERDDVVHTCRNFERIQEWGEKNFYSSMLDLETHVEWDINA